MPTRSTERSGGAAPSSELDRWAVSRLQATVGIVRERMDDFDATNAGRAIQDFVDELSNWYVRRSRRRFWDGDPAAFGTLRTCLLTVAGLLAPFCPFMADEMYDNLDGDQASIHLCDFPEPGEREVELEEQMTVVAGGRPARPGRPGSGKAQDPPASAGGRGRGRRTRADGDRAL